MVAGIGGVIALGCFYRALAIGTMSIVAPISATGVTLPVVVGIATGDRLSTVVAVGLAVTFVGVLLASREQHDDAERAAAGKLSVGWRWWRRSASARTSSCPTRPPTTRCCGCSCCRAASRSRRSRSSRGRAGCARPPAARRATLVAAGTLDCSATALYAVANTKGALSIVSVVGSLYPVMTLILARAVLGERIRRAPAGRASRRRWPASR